MFSRVRKYKRLTHVVAFAYRCHASDSEVMFGVTSNMSASGMCMYSDSWLDVGQSIEFRSFLPVPFRTAVVTWTRKDVNDLYKIGVRFVE